MPSRNRKVEGPFPPKKNTALEKAVRKGRAVEWEWADGARCGI